MKQDELFVTQAVVDRVETIYLSIYLFSYIIKIARKEAITHHIRCEGLEIATLIGEKNKT